MHDEFEKILFEINEGVATITINRPEARNALDEAVRRDLNLAIAHIEKGSKGNIHAAILTGAGGAFCAGGDISALRNSSGKPAAEMREKLRSSHQLMTRWYNLDIPTIAAVSGTAAGAGFSLALACDFVLAELNARFILSFGRIGLVPDWGALYLLPRIVGLQKAKELCFSARILEAKEAYDIGIVYKVVDNKEVLSEAKTLASRFQSASSLSIGMTKSMLNSSYERDLKTSLEIESSAQAIANNSDYHREAVKRFINKQPSIFDWEKSS